MAKCLVGYVDIKPLFCIDLSKHPMVSGTVVLASPIEILNVDSPGCTDQIVPVYPARSPIKSEEFGGGQVRDGIIRKLMKVSTCLTMLSF